MKANNARGIRNNNPGNIRWGDHWRGLVPQLQQTDKAFCQFVSPEYGIRAMMMILKRYQKQHGLNTIAGIIHRWAPPEENDTQAYINSVVTVTGIPAHKQIDVTDSATMLKLVQAIPAHEQIDVTDSATMLKLVQAIIAHENGYQPYDASVLQRAEKLAHE